MGLVAGSMVWAGIKVGVFDAGASPSRIEAIGLGYLIIKVSASKTIPNIKTKIKVRLVTFNNLFTR